MGSPLGESESELFCFDCRKRPVAVEFVSAPRRSERKFPERLMKFRQRETQMCVSAIELCKETFSCAENN
jgi:hypothetical protein